MDVIDNPEQVMLVLLLVLVMIGLIYLSGYLIYRNIQIDLTMARARKTRREEKRAEEIQSAQQRRELLADLREYGLTEDDFDRPHEDVVARIKDATELHRQAIEGLGGAGRSGAASG